MRARPAFVPAPGLDGATLIEGFVQRHVFIVFNPKESGKLPDRLAGPA